MQARPSQKLDAKDIGPLKILPLELKFPPAMQIHSLFNTNLLSLITPVPTFQSS